MIASVLVEYNTKALNKVFDYIIPDVIKNEIRVGHKVIVPFASKVIEGFVLNIHDNYDKDTNYREVIDISQREFYLNEELLSLGNEMSEELVCSKISAYQTMLPKAYKASIKTNLSKKYISYVMLNENIDIDKYISMNKRNKRECEILLSLKDGRKIKSEFPSASINKLIEKNIIYLVKEEVSRLNTSDFVCNENVVLNKEQFEVYNTILGVNENNIFLLHGVTGSGKTEIYIKLIDDMLKKGKRAIVLVPEISLTPQIISKFKSRFGDILAVLHSGLSDGERYDEYRKIMSGDISIVVGARSAVFAPLDNIGLIIVDECQSTTYKQESNPKYNAIDIAIKRSNYHNAKCVLGSATPLLEQYARGLKGVYKLVSLDKRVSGNNPSTVIVDMMEEVKKRNFVISSVLDEEIKKCLSDGRQAIILLNRRGYSTFVSCSSCGFVYKCPNCDISLTYYKSSNSLSCHYCGYRTSFKEECPKCKEKAINNLGLGTEKLEALLKEKYKGARVLRMDHDTTRGKNAHHKMIEDFKNKNYDILVGTQMISKGHNFNNVTVVGIVNIDSSLNIPDFRSSERTFELLMQTGGRASRYDLPGKVIVQTYNPDNFIFDYFKKCDYKGFFKHEMSIRKKLGYTPYYYLCLIKIVSNSFEKSRDEASKIKKYLDNKLSEEFIILGPSVGNIVRVNNKYNFSIIIKYKKINNLLEVLNDLSYTYINNKVSIDIDINPYNLF